MSFQLSLQNQAESPAIQSSNKTKEPTAPMQLTPGDFFKNQSISGIAEQFFQVPTQGQSTPAASEPSLADRTRILAKEISSIAEKLRASPFLDARVEAFHRPQATTAFHHPVEITSSGSHSNAFPLASATSEHSDPSYMGHPAGAASSSSVTAAPPIAKASGKEIIIFPGLNNSCGNDCWANSLLQMMATVPTLQAIAYKLAELKGRRDPRGYFLYLPLEQLMKDRASHSPISEATSLHFRFAIRDTLSSAQRISDGGIEDAAEVLRIIMTNYEECFKDRRTTLHFTAINTKHFKLEPNIIDNRPTAQFSQIEQGNITNEQTVDWMILVTFDALEQKLKSLTEADIDRQEKTLFTELMWSYFDSTRKDANLATYINPDTQRLSTYKLIRENTRFSTPPEEFILSLNRFIATGKTLENGYPELRKITVKAPLLERFTLPAAYATTNTTYEVDSFVRHDGGLNGGHYISYQKINGKWYCFNDASVHQADSREVKESLQNCYFLHYKKLETVDPTAFTLPTRNFDEDIEPQQLTSVVVPHDILSSPASITAAKPAGASAAASSGRVPPSSKKDSHVEEVIIEQLIQLTDQRESLRSLQDAINSNQNKDNLQRFFELLPLKLRQQLIAALAIEHGRLLAQTEIQAHPGFKDEISYGVARLRENSLHLVYVLKCLQTSSLLSEIFSQSEKILVKPLIEAAFNNKNQTMLDLFNKMDTPLKEKICKLTYQVDVIDKAEQHIVKMLLSEQISLLGRGIITKVIKMLDSEIEKLKRLSNSG